MTRRRRLRWRRPVRKGQAPLWLVARSLMSLLLVVILAGGWAVWTYRGPGPLARSGPTTTVFLEHGAGVAQIAHVLKRAGVISSEKIFVLAAQLGGAARSLKAGEYAVRSGASMASILTDIQAGKVVRHQVTVPEGWTSAMAADALRREPVLSGEVETPPEGSILPDTYLFERGDARSAVVHRMRAAQDKALAELWAARAPGLPFQSPQEAVTLASIIEKETALAAERPRIAAVFVNRLRAQMRLESDPTIIYGISQGRPLGRGITLSELNTATPYNTYRIDGLPPTPIANPGRASLAAVLNPPQTTELFFVANGQGGHVFASTFAEHERNVARWRRVERARAADARK